MAYDVTAVRRHFPALDRGTTFFDGPAGTQVPAECADAVAAYLRDSNSNSTHGASFRGTPAAERTNAIVEDAHRGVAAFLGATDPEECVFGPNMTTLAFAMSRRIGASLRPGDEIVVSAIDHDANIAPWLALAEERGLVLRWVEPVLPECRIDPASVVAAIGPRTRVVSLGRASNAVGTLLPPADLADVADAAHRAGALVWVDAVHAAAHVPLDVADSGADVVLCSAYKIYGPHLGIVWGRREVLDALPSQNVRWPGAHLPARLETGTTAYELLAGLLGTLDYLRWLGRTFGGPGSTGDGARSELRAALTVIREYEATLCARLLTRLSAIQGCRIFGVTDPARVEERCPTVAFTLPHTAPAAVADACSRGGLAVWSGEFASFELMRRLGVPADEGVVRVGIAHYTTHAEVDRLADLLTRLAAPA